MKMACAHRVDTTAEDRARELLHRMGVDGPFTSGDLVELANLIAAVAGVRSEVKRWLDDGSKRLSELDDTTDEYRELEVARVAAADRCRHRILALLPPEITR